MARDPYSLCPCGSGKKYKWCCQNIFVDIERAFQQEAEGQHETALRTMDEVVRKHADNPEAWGRKAELLFQQGRTDEGEEVLQKAFDLNPNYPWGLALRAPLRAAEGRSRAPFCSRAGLPRPMIPTPTTIWPRFTRSLSRLRCVAIGPSPPTAPCASW